jgi:tRNA A-37 threonylcarbamoyl transferase component Bud32
MRAVLRGAWDGPRGPQPIVVKWSRPDTLADRVSRRVRGGKGVREGRVLRALRPTGVGVPEVLAWTDEGQDVLVTQWEEDLRPLPPADDATPEQIEDVATLLALAHGAGLRHRDLHAGNLALRGRAPVIVDLGGARLGPPLTEAQRVPALARAAHGLLAGARRSQRLRALVAYMRCLHGRGGRSEARAVARQVEAALTSVRRAWRLGRDRRATRDGRHFALFTTPAGRAGVRNRDVTDASWEARADAWLDADPPDAVPLKAGGLVLRSGDVVLKRHGPVATGRLPRPVRALRLAHALATRGIPAPTGCLAACEEDGRGLVATRWVDAPNLHDFVADGRYAALAPAARRRLLEGIGRTLRALHDAELSHRDLKAPNLLVRADLTIVVADLDGARVRRRPVRWARRARDLMRLDASLDLPDTARLRILGAYHDVLPRPPLPLGELAAEVARLARRKRGPSGRPR